MFHKNLWAKIEQIEENLRRGYVQNPFVGEIYTDYYKDSRGDFDFGSNKRWTHIRLNEIEDEVKDNIKVKCLGWIDKSYFLDYREIKERPYEKERDKLEKLIKKEDG